MEGVRRKNARGAPMKPVTYCGAQVLKACAPQLTKCYDIRNEVVHNLGNKHKLILRDVYQLEDQTSTFNIFFSLFLESQFDLKFGEGDA
jgi:hypothetical protein